MGRNGAGKSTLLRHLAALQAPTRGRVTTSGRVALLLQNPGDYLLHERAGDEASARALAAVGLTGLDDRHPRDLSGGERQRLALAIVLDGDDAPCAVLLDEPTRGMDRAAKGELAARLRTMAAQGAAVLVATHDAEFAAAVAERVILLADGRPIADAPASEVLSGGWHFATETARVLGGAGGALTPDDGAALLRAPALVSALPAVNERGDGAVSWEIASLLILARRARHRVRSGTSARSPARGCSRWSRRSPGWRRSGASPSRRSRTSSRRPTSC